MEYTMENLRTKLAESNGRIAEYLSNWTSLDILKSEIAKRDFIESILAKGISEGKDPVRAAMEEKADRLSDKFSDCRDATDDYLHEAGLFLRELLSTIEDSDLSLTQCVCVTVYGDNLPSVSHRLYVRRLWVDEKNEVILQGCKDRTDGELSFAELGMVEHMSVDILMDYIMEEYGKAELTI